MGTQKLTSGILKSTSRPNHIPHSWMRRTMLYWTGFESFLKDLDISGIDFWYSGLGFSLFCTKRTLDYFEIPLNCFQNLTAGNPYLSEPLSICFPRSSHNCMTRELAQRFSIYNWYSENRTDSATDGYHHTWVFQCLHYTLCQAFYHIYLW